MSFGTEGRRPDDEVPPSDNIYEYIVFRGSDVKDLRIEEAPKENKPPPPPKVPDDPAILGVSFHDCYYWTFAQKQKIFYVMKYFGCKSSICTTESAKTMRIFSVAFLLI